MLKRVSILIVLSLLSVLVWMPAVQAQDAPQFCGEPSVVTLTGGQTIPTGTVTIANDEDTLYVIFETTDPWMLTETHVHIASDLSGIPTNRRGIPVPGQFDYSANHDPAVDYYEYSFAVEEWMQAGEFVVAAHAAVEDASNPDDVQSETAWGGDNPGDGPRWWFYATYTWQECEDEPEDPDTGSETAFAFGGDLATCFLDLDFDQDGKGDFNRWGWTNGTLSAGTYEFDIYAGAGQCDTEKGTLVGTLEVDYNGIVASVCYKMTDGSDYMITETHLYVGNAILPMDNGEYTVAPGQYDYINENDPRAAECYTVPVSGDIYVVAHAVVTGIE